MGSMVRADSIDQFTWVCSTCESKEGPNSGYGSIPLPVTDINRWLSTLGGRLLVYWKICPCTTTPTMFLHDEDLSHQCLLLLINRMWYVRASYYCGTTKPRVSLMLGYRGNMGEARVGRSCGNNKTNTGLDLALLIYSQTICLAYKHQGGMWKTNISIK